MALLTHLAMGTHVSTIRHIVSAKFVLEWWRLSRIHNSEQPTVPIVFVSSADLFLFLFALWERGLASRCGGKRASVACAFPHTPNPVCLVPSCLPDLFLLVCVDARSCRQSLAYTSEASDLSSLTRAKRAIDLTASEASCIPSLTRAKLATDPPNQHPPSETEQQETQSYNHHPEQLN